MKGGLAMAKVSIPVEIEMQLHAFANRVLFSFSAADRVTHREFLLRKMSRKRFIKKMMGEEGLSRNAANGLADALISVFGSYSRSYVAFQLGISGAEAGHGFWRGYWNLDHQRFEKLAGGGDGNG